MRVLRGLFVWRVLVRVSVCTRVLLEYVNIYGFVVIIELCLRGADGCERRGCARFARARPLANVSRARTSRAREWRVRKCACFQQL